MELTQPGDQRHARRAPSRLVSVTGIAGIGKSRLDVGARPLGRRAPPRDQRGTTAAPSPTERESRSPRVAQMIRRRARIAGWRAAPRLDSPAARFGAQELIRDDAERRWIEPRLRPLLARAEEAAFERDELFAAWRRFFERVSGADPGRPRFRGSPMGRSEPARLHRAHGNLVEDPHPHLHPRAGPPRAARPPTIVGLGVGSFTGLNLERLPDDVMRELLAQRAPDLRRELVQPILEERPAACPSMRSRLPA